MVLGSFQCRGVLLLWHMVGQGPAVPAASAGRVGYFSFFFISSILSSFSSVSSVGRRLDILILVLVWFLFYGPSTHFRSFRAQSVNLATLFLGKPPRQFYQYLVHILSPVTDNCSSWISGRGRMAVEMFSWPNLHERICRTWGSNSGPLACQANSLSIELPRPVGHSEILWSRPF